MKPSKLELIIAHDNLVKRLAIVKAHLPKETDPGLYNMRVRYVAAMERRIEELKQRIGGN